MQEKRKIEKFFKEKNGLCKYSELIDLGLSQRDVKLLKDNHVLESVGRGIYNHKDYLPDMLKVYQMENQKLIYSHETAAYLHGLTDRFPREYTVTTPSGYHLRRDKELKIYYIKKECFQLGVMELTDSLGNNIRAYDKEKTLCDIIRSKERIELQVYSEVIQNYFNGKVNMYRLSKYAKKLKISDSLMNIITLMMKP
ncbi:MAG: hypothetical protein PHD70_06125 [Anaerostipes sp.]|jgi:hypothetical protein|nr:hypothetical protein [Anaerostipes sp.]